MSQKMLRKNQKGFTLIELMIVVAIIGILAATAIPNFLQYQLKAKTAEVKTNLAAIATNEEAYRAETDNYITCASAPAAAAAASPTKQGWVTNAGYTAIGFTPSGDVYYMYEVVAVAGAAGTSPSFTATGTGDLDGDGNQAVYTVTNTAAFTGPATAGAF